MIQKIDFLCHSTTPEMLHEILEQQYIPAGRFATINKLNDYRSCKIVFIVYEPEEILVLDNCIENGVFYEAEFLMNDQVELIEDVDFTLNADLLYYIDETGVKHEIKK